MKCSETYVWLLATPPGARPPRSVRRHVRDCGRCRRRRCNLRRLDRELAGQAVPAGSPDLPARFLRQIESWPVQPAAPVVQSAAGWPRLVLALAAAVLLGFGFAWLIFQEDASVSPPVAAAFDNHLLTRFLERDLRLAETHLPREQLAVLTDMAADLRAEAFRLVEKGQPEELPLVTGLYDRVVRRGLVGRSRALPEEEKDRLVPPLLQKLQETAASVEQTAAAARPAVGDFIRPLGLTARAGSKGLLDLDEPLLPDWRTPPPAPPGTPQALLSALVVHGLLLAEEDDPLRRADYCGDMANHMVQAIVLASARGDQDSANLLGRQLGSVLDRGVTPNLGRFQAKDPEDPNLAELKQLIEKLVPAIQALEYGVDSGEFKPHKGGGPPWADPNHAQIRDLDKAIKDFQKVLKKVGRPGGPHHKDDKEKGPEPREKEREREKEKEREKEREREKEKKGPPR